MAAPSSRSFVLFGSTDGTHWEIRTKLETGASVFRLLETQGRLLAGGYGRAYASDDAGASWREIRIDWDNAWSITALIEHQGSVYAANGRGMYVSSDLGESWRKLASAPSVWTLLSMGDILIAAGDAGVSRSTDGGTTWETRDEAPSQGLRLKSNSSGTALLSVKHTTGFSAPPAVIYRSVDSGRTWQSASLTGEAINDIAFSNGSWQVATLNGLFSSSDDGLTWKALPGITPYPRAVNSLEATDDGLLAGVAGVGIWRRAGEVGPWEYASQGSFPIGVAQIEMIPEGMLALSLKENQLYFRATNATVWEMRHYPLSEKPGGFLLDEGRLYLSTTGAVLASTDWGASWTRQSTGFSGTEVCQVMTRSGQGILSGVKGSGLMISNDSDGSWRRIPEPYAEDWYHFLTVGTTMYAATVHGLLISTDHGETWQSDGVQDPPYLQFRLALWNDDIIAACNDGVWSYTPSRRQWTKKYSGPTYAIAATHAGVFAITRDDRVIRFSRALDTFEAVNDGLPDAGFVSPSVCRAELRELDGRLYIGACSLPGLFSLDLSNLTSIDNEPIVSDEAFIESIWPSPATGRTSIAWSIATAGTVRLELADILGRVVRRLAAGTFDAGRHVSSLNTAGLAGGLYLCRLTSGGRRATRVIVIH